MRFFKFFVVVFFILLIAIVLFFIYNFSAKIIGRATQPVNLNITVFASPPILEIEKPDNETYFYNKNLEVKVESTGSNVWYNLNHGNNITLKKQGDEFRGYFNASNGAHTAYVFANNSDGNLTSDYVSFNINYGYYSFNFSQYSGGSAGSSTNFNQHSFGEIQNLSNITLENASYGFINFLEGVNLTNDANPFDNATNLDFHIDILFNHIEINTSALPNFNVSARLKIKGLTFANPLLLQDGVSCPESVCKTNSYSGGILDFNVSHFTAYSAAEGGSGGVSAGGSTSTASDKGGLGLARFKVDKERVNLNLKKGEIEDLEIEIENTGNIGIEFNLSLTGPIKGIAELTDNNFKLFAFESKTVKLKFLAEEDILPGLYIGKLEIIGGDIKREVLITISVSSEEELFDFEINIPAKYRDVNPAGKLVSDIRIFDLEEEIDVNIKYEIRNAEGDLILTETESRLISGEISFTKEFIIPENIAYGDYILYVEIVHNDNVAGASAYFKVVKNKLFKEILFIVVIVLILIISLLTKYHKKKRSKN